MTHKDIMWGLFILGSLVHSALGLQDFLETPSYSEVNPGTRVVLPCFVKDKGGECRWEKDGNPVGIFEDKYEWAGNLNKGNCSLAILDASSEYDDGVWQCQVIDCSKYLVSSYLGTSCCNVLCLPGDSLQLQGGRQLDLRGRRGGREGGAEVGRA